mgnify:CR=1 FL=1
MQPLLIILLLLSVLTNVLLILLLLRSGQQNTAEDQTDEIARIVRDEVEAETEVLADQLRVMQGEVTRTTSASARDMGTLLAESQRQSQEAATARLDAIDRAGAARAGAVHAHLKRALQEQDFGVLAAQLDDAVRPRGQLVGRHAGGKHLLHEWDLHALRHAHAGRAGDGKHRLPAAALRHPPQKLRGGLFHPF